MEKGLNNCISPSQPPCAVQPFYWVIENPPIVSLILTHQVAENNLEADERGL